MIAAAVMRLVAQSNFFSLLRLFAHYLRRNDKFVLLHYILYTILSNRKLTFKNTFNVDAILFRLNDMRIVLFHLKKLPLTRTLHVLHFISIKAFSDLLLNCPYIRFCFFKI